MGDFDNAKRVIEWATKVRDATRAQVRRWSAQLGDQTHAEAPGELEDQVRDMTTAYNDLVSGLSRPFEQIDTLLEARDDGSTKSAELRMNVHKWRSAATSLKSTLCLCVFHLELLQAKQHRMRSEPEAEAHFERALELVEEASVAVLPTIVAYHMGALVRARGLVRGVALEPVAPRDSGGIERSLWTRRVFSLLSACALVRAWPRFLEVAAVIEHEFGPRWWDASSSPPRFLALLALSELEQGQIESALSHAGAAMEIMEQRYLQLDSDVQRRNLGSEEGVSRTYGSALVPAVRAAAAGGPLGPDARRLFDWSERGRARALLDLLRTASVVDLDHESVGVGLGRWRELDVQLELWTQRLVRLQLDPAAATDARREAERRIHQLQRDQLEFVKQLRSHAPSLGLILGGSPPRDLDEVRARLVPGQLMVNYVYLSDRLLGWVIDVHGVAYAFERVCDYHEIERLAWSLWSSCRNGEDPGGAGERLAALLLEPCGPWLEDARTLVFVLFGELHRVPFAALPFAGRTLGETHIISQTPSASVFIRELSRPGVANVVVVGNPTGMAVVADDGTKQNLASLPGAEREAREIAALYPEATLLGGTEARSARVREEMKRAAVVHLATHGWVKPRAPLDSAVALADGDILHVHELMSSSLQGALVVLSACETGLGERTGGDEIIGFGRALLTAGARAVVLSLWRIPDAETSPFMLAFHRALVAGAEAAAALHIARQCFEVRQLGDDAKREVEPETATNPSARVNTAFIVIE